MKDWSTKKSATNLAQLKRREQRVRQRSNKTLEGKQTHNNNREKEEGLCEMRETRVEERDRKELEHECDIENQRDEQAQA
jgi:hypothetical protein